MDEKEAAALLVRMDSEFKGLGEGGLAGLKTKVEALDVLIRKTDEDAKKLNVAEVLKEIERMKASFDATVKAIRGNKSGLYLPGVEDEKFSLLKTFIAIKVCGAGGDQKKAFESEGAGLEYEILSQVRAKHRDKIAALKANAQNIGSDQYGGNFVPDQVVPELIAAIYTKSVFINLTGEGTQRLSVMDGLYGGNVKIPKFLGGMIAYWIGEEDEYADSAVKTGDITMNPKKLGCLARITDAMRRFAGFGYDKLFQTDFIRAMAKKLDWTCMYGSGSDNSARGIVNVKDIKIYSAQSKGYGVRDTDAIGGTTNSAGTTSFQADWLGAELDFDGIDNMKLLLEEDDIEIDSSAALISCPRFFTRLKQLKVKNYDAQTDEKPYLLGLPMIPDNRLAELIGPFGKSNQFPTANKPGASFSAPSASGTAKFTDVVYGNLMDVILGRWSGIEIEDDEGKGKGFTSDAIYVKSRMYCDLGYRQPRSLIVCPDAKVRT